MPLVDHTSIVSSRLTGTILYNILRLSYVNYKKQSQDILTLSHVCLLRIVSHCRIVAVIVIRPYLSIF